METTGAIDQALDLYRLPRKVDAYRSQPLPADVNVLLQALANDPDDAVALPLDQFNIDASPSEVLGFYIEQIMLFPGSSAYRTLTSLDFLGFGLPPGSPSLGELLLQGKTHLQAPWLGLSGFVVIALMLSLLIFIGEAVRDAFDPRKTFA